MRVWLYAFAVIVALTSSSVGAQSCALLPAEEEADVLEGLHDMLFNPEFAESRDSAIQQLGPVTDPGMAVKDDSVCQAVAQRIVARAAIQPSLETAGPSAHHVRVPVWAILCGYNQGDGRALTGCAHHSYRQGHEYDFPRG